MTHSTIYQTDLVHEVVSLRSDFKLSDETKDVLEYHWYLVEESESHHLTASCLGSTWVGIKAA